MTNSNDIIVRCEGLTKLYGEITALEDLNLDIPRGCVFGYIGHNGAGKTTTIRILAGLLASTRGKATIAGVDVTDRRRIKSLVGYMPDSFGVYDRMRVWEYLDFFGAAFKIPKAKRRQRIDYVMDVTDSEYMRDRFVEALSKGMKQRVGIARTLMHDPQVLLLDEPASGLDPQARVQMRHLLRRLAEAGKTLLISSHILPELAAICDAIGIIHKGRLKAFGPIQKVLSEIRRDRLMELKAVSGLDAAVEILKGDPQCSKLDDSDAASGMMRFHLNGDDEHLAALVGSILAGGTKLATIREVPLSLEDAYMAISAEVPESTEDTAEASQEGDAKC